MPAEACLLQPATCRRTDRSATPPSLPKGIIDRFWTAQRSVVTLLVLGAPAATSTLSGPRALVACCPTASATTHRRTTATGTEHPAHHRAGPKECSLPSERPPSTTRSRYCAVRPRPQRPHSRRRPRCRQGRTPPLEAASRSRVQVVAVRGARGLPRCAVVSQ
jgi:hypothetical protein